VKAAVGPVSSAEAKPGVKTTEFWLATAVALMGALAAVFVEAEWARVAGMVAAVLSSAGYGFSRARVKEAELLAPMAANVVWGKDGEPVIVQDEVGETHGSLLQ